MEYNWDGAYELVEESSVPRSANKMGYHAVYKVRDASADGELVIKAGNVLHRN